VYLVKSDVTDRQNLSGNTNHTSTYRRTSTLPTYEYTPVHSLSRRVEDYWEKPSDTLSLIRPRSSLYLYNTKILGQEIENYC
jgi:hypothetical protein